MDTYALLREIAGSWMLLVMFIFFVGVVVYVLAGKRSRYDDAAESIFRHEDRPAPDPGDSGQGGGKEARK